MKLSATAMPISPSKQGRPPRKVDLSNTNDDQDQAGKENKISKVAGGKGRAASSIRAPQRSTRAAVKKAYCVCRRPDDGTPMVNCSECRDW